MGICVHLHISDTTIQAEWEPAYRESLRFVARLPVMDVRQKKIHGAKPYCAVHVKEHQEKGKRFWRACGDLETMELTEENRLWRELPEASPEPAVDILFSCLRDMDLEGIPGEYIGSRHWSYWNGDTRNTPVHLQLIAAACLLEDLLPGQVICDGDITLNQCREAARMASEALDRVVRIPVRCDPERLHARVRAMPLASVDVARCFLALYLGPRDGALGQFLRDHFSGEELHACWIRTFQKDLLYTRAYQDDLRDYLAMSFPIPDLRQYLPMVRHAGTDVRSVFQDALNRILDAELHIREKNCEDVTDSESQSGVPDRLAGLMAVLGSIGVRNERVDRYIPLPELRAQLEACMGEYCDVPARIAEWTAEREKKSTDGVSQVDGLQEVLRTFRDTQWNEIRKYDAIECRGLLHFQPGWKLFPDLERELAGHVRTLRECTGWDEFREVQALTAEEQFRILARNSVVLPLTPEDWERIWDRLHTDRDALARYLPMALFEMGSSGVQMLMRALICNDDLYEYCMQHLQEDSGKAEV